MRQMHKLGILGCGDYLKKWQAPEIKASSRVQVKSLFDPERSRAEKYAIELGGSVAESAESILKDPDVDIVCLFVPPGIRKNMLVTAAAAGKHIITTKPLGSNVRDCAAMVNAVQTVGVKCGVGYWRTGNPTLELYKDIFDSGEIGQLALYKHDWIHHYPEWNTWATDPKKNGGPFMDAMIHTLNLARYLMPGKITNVTFFSDNHAQTELKCNDTEFMKADFERGGAAHLFITWAADLAVYDKNGNERELLDINYMITDQRWRVTGKMEDAGFTVTASRDGKEKKWVAQPMAVSTYDSFAEAIETDRTLPRDLPDIVEAYEDIKIMRDAEKSQGQKMKVDLSVIK